MRFRLPTIKIIHGETDHVLISGRVKRRPTVLIRIGKKSLSKKAFIIGIALAICQLLDGLLTYVGLSLSGVHMEGNTFLRYMMHIYGMAPALFFVKIIGLSIAIGLALHSHKRRWMRPVLVGIVAFYIILAILPWTVIISNEMNAKQKATANQDLSYQALESDSNPLS